MKIEMCWVWLRSNGVVVDDDVAVDDNVVGIGDVVIAVADGSFFDR